MATWDVSHDWQCHRFLEIWGKCRDRSEIVKCLSSGTLFLTLCTKSSFTKDGRPLHTSSCMFYHPSLNTCNHFLTMPSLIALSKCTWQIWWWISLGSTFLALKKQITDRISQSAARQLSFTCLKHRNKHKHNTNFTKWHVVSQLIKSLHMHKVTISRMRERYAQMALSEQPMYLECTYKIQVHIFLSPYYIKSF